MLGSPSDVVDDAERGDDDQCVDPQDPFHRVARPSFPRLNFIDKVTGKTSEPVELAFRTRLWKQKEHEQVNGISYMLTALLLSSCIMQYVGARTGTHTADAWEQTYWIVIPAGLSMAMSFAVFIWPRHLTAHAGLNVGSKDLDTADAIKRALWRNTFFQIMWAAGISCGSTALLVDFVPQKNWCQAFSDILNRTTSSVGTPKGMAGNVITEEDISLFMTGTMAYWTIATVFSSSHMLVSVR